MSNELEQIMKRRLEKSETNHTHDHDNTSTTSTRSSSIIECKKNNDDMPNNHHNHHYHDNTSNGGTSTNKIKTNQPLTIITQQQHNDLQGKERLWNIIQCLEKSCPWTKSVSSKEMLQWLRSELIELEKEIHDYDNVCNTMMTCISNNNISNVDEEMVQEVEEGQDTSCSLLNLKKMKMKQDALKQSLTSEMGDILFDALMLDMMIRR